MSVAFGAFLMTFQISGVQYNLRRNVLVNTRTTLSTSLNGILKCPLNFPTGLLIPVDRLHCDWRPPLAPDRSLNPHSATQRGFLEIASTCTQLLSKGQGLLDQKPRTLPPLKQNSAEFRILWRQTGEMV